MSNSQPPTYLVTARADKGHTVTVTVMANDPIAAARSARAMTGGEVVSTRKLN